MKWHNKFIPTKYKKDVYEVDYNKLKEEGIKTLLFDLDNTLIPYDIDVIPEDTTNFLENLSKDFNVVVISNSRLKRVRGATSHLKDIPFVKFATKPLKRGIKKALKFHNSKPSETAIIGDQIMTDIFGGSRSKIKEKILIYPIKKKSDHISTRINRTIEQFVIKRIKKKDIKAYEKVLKDYVER